MQLNNARINKLTQTLRTVKQTNIKVVRFSHFCSLALEEASCPVGFFPYLPCLPSPFLLFSLQLIILLVGLSPPLKVFLLLCEQ